MHSLTIITTRSCPLTTESYEKTWMEGLAHADPHGRPSPLLPTHLVVGANRAEGAHAIASDRLHAGKVEVLVIAALGDVWALADLRNWPVADGDTVAISAVIQRVHAASQTTTARG
jgi:hypothetical protein